MSLWLVSESGMVSPERLEPSPVRLSSQFFVQFSAREIACYLAR